MTTFDLYCFDLDDTLVETFPHVSSVLYLRLAEQLGLPAPTVDAIRHNWGRPLPESLGALFAERARPEDVVAQLRKLHRQCPVRAQPHAQRILSVLRRHGRCIAVFSRGDPEIVTSTLRSALGLAETDLDALRFVSNRENDNTSGAMIDEIRADVRRRRNRQIEADRVLVVSDVPRDRHLALESGARFRGLTTGVFTLDDYVAAGTPTNEIFPSLAAALAAPTDHGVVAIIQDHESRFLLVREGRRANPFFGAWSGPHGTCKAEDVLEEETVVRETREECGLRVRPLRRLYESPADTKVQTVAFWSAKPDEPSQRPDLVCPQEISEIGWFTLDQIRSPQFPLYAGTRDFFSKIDEMAIL